MAFALGRAAKRLIAVGVALVVLVAALLWALPEIVRRVAVDQASKTLGRAVAIDDVDLNLFTRRLAVKKFKIAEAKGPEAFVAFERLDVHFAYWPLFHSDVRLPEIALDGLAVRVVRTGPAEFNFSDIVEKFSQPAPEKPPSKWTVTVDRVNVTRTSIDARDQQVTPAAEWRLGGLDIQAAALTTRPNQPPGTLKVSARLNNESPLAVDATGIQLAPSQTATARVSLGDFDLVRVVPYVPPEVPASLRSGKLAVDVTVSVEKAPDALRKATAAGEVRLDALSVLERDQPDPFLTVGRVALGIKSADLVARAATVTVDVDGLSAKAARTKDGEISPLAAFTKAGAEAPAGGGSATPAAASAPAKSEPAPPPSPPFKVTVERIALRSGTVTLADLAVTPARTWTIADLAVDGAGLSTAAEASPGRLTSRARIASSPGRAKPASLAIDADSLRLMPLAASAKVKLDGFDVTSALPYLPDTLPASPSKGTLGVDLAAQVEHGESGLSRALVSGSVKLDDTAIVQRGAPKPFLALPRLAVAIKQVDAVAHAVSLSRIELQGLDVRAVRDAKGDIDLLGLVATAAPPGGAPAPAAAPKPVRPPPPPPSADGSPAPAVSAPAAPSPPAQIAAPAAPAPGEWRVGLDRFVLSKGTATFDDQSVSPATSLALGDIAITADQLSWPPTKKASLTLSVSMPGGGKTEIKGGGTLEPLNLQIRTNTQDAPIEPYQPYFPFVARMFGLFSGDSVSEIQHAPDGTLILASRGNAWARKLEVRGPDSEEPVSRTEELEIQKIDFSWPNYALVDLVRIKHPEAQIERAENGEINMRKLFAPRPKPGAEGGAEERPAEEKPAEAPAGPGPASSPDDKSGPAAMVLDFNEIRIEDGLLRFLDRTTKPAFSEDVSKLALSVKNLSNVLGRQRTTMSVQALVGGDAALDMRGEMSGLAEAFHADLVGELRDFALASANPYADSLTSWIVQRGKLTAKIHYRIDGDRLSAQHDVKFAGLNVQKARESDEAKQKLGVPLGLAVALLKDRRGDIDFDVPISGTLSDKKFDWGEAMWSGIKQVLLKVLAAPFNAIGRMFTGGGDKVEELAINPVTFEPGSSVIAPSAELQITRVADFLRRSPYVKVDLTSVATKADTQSIKSHEALARVQQFQRDKGLAELADALRAYYAQNLPGVALPGTADAQLALLAERQEVLPSALEDLVTRRLDGVTDRLVKAEGIPSERVSPAKPAAPDKEVDGEGRVEFVIASE